MKIHHIGYLVKKIEKSIKIFEELGYTLIKDVVSDDYRQADICFLEKDGYVVELVSPVSKDSVVAQLMKDLGNTPYHICYETENIEEEVDRLLKQHYVVCSEIHSAAAIDDKKVCFMINSNIGMIELLEV